MHTEPQSNSAAGTRAGNGRLCHELRGLNPVRCFTATVDEIARQLTLADSVESHDTPLPDDVLQAADDWHLNHVGGALSEAQRECANSLHALRKAHASVAGLFKGSLRDNTEEALARAVKGAEARLEQISAAVASYKVPRLPHDIRRDSLAFLYARCPGIIAALTSLIANCDGVSPDLVERLKACESELTELMHTFGRLRERSSQKMGANMLACVDRIKAINESLDEIGIEAGIRGGNLYRYPSWNRIAQARAATRAATT